jgi:hypothetical protein
MQQSVQRVYLAPQILAGIARHHLVVHGIHLASPVWAMAWKHAFMTKG